MLFILWLSIPLFFWAAYFLFTKGCPFRHIGFLHYLTYFLSIYAGSYAIYLENGGTNHSFIAAVMAYPIISFLGMIIGLLFGNQVYSMNVEVKPSATSKETIIVLGFTSLFLAVLTLYLIILGKNIPILVALTGSRQEGHVARYIATKGYQEVVGGIGALVWIPRILIDYFGIFLLVFAYYQLRNQPAGYLRLAIFIIGLCVICLAFGEKYPVLKLLFYFSLEILGLRSELYLLLYFSSLRSFSLWE
jgi:hypothetical protein